MMLNSNRVAAMKMTAWRNKAPFSLILPSELGSLFRPLVFRPPLASRAQQDADAALLGNNDLMIFLYWLHIYKR